jgi:hypothetical protein
MIPLNCITRVVALTSTSLPRFVTQFHHPTRTKDHLTRAKKKFNKWEKEKKTDEYILLRNRFLAPPLLILLFGLQNNQRETKERRFWCKKTKLTSTPLSLYPFAASTTLSRPASFFLLAVIVRSPWTRRPTSLKSSMLDTERLFFLPWSKSQSCPCLFLIVFVLISISFLFW